MCNSACVQGTERKDVNIYHKFGTHQHSDLVSIFDVYEEINWNEAEVGDSNNKK